MYGELFFASPGVEKKASFYRYNQYGTKLLGKL